MDDYKNKNISISSEELFFNMNNKQVMFKTDKQTVEKLNDVSALKWSTKMIFLLIALRDSVNDEFNSSKYTFKLWKLIATQMNSGTPSVKVTAKDCDNKWKNLVATYHKNVERIKYTSDFSIRWEHFAAMDEILKATNELKNPDSFIEVDETAVNNNTNEEDGRSYDNTMTSVGKKSKSHQPYFYGVQNVMNSIGNENVHCVIPTQDVSKSNQPPKWFFNYMKRKEVTDAYKYENLKSMITDLQHSQRETRRLILCIFQNL